MRVARGEDEIRTRVELLIRERKVARGTIRFHMHGATKCVDHKVIPPAFAARLSLNGEMLALASRIPTRLLDAKARHRLMRVRDYPADKLCDVCRARIAAMKTHDELTLLKALCADCEGAVAATDGLPVPRARCHRWGRWMRNERTRPAGSERRAADGRQHQAATTPARRMERGHPADASLFLREDVRHRRPWRRVGCAA